MSDTMTPYDSLVAKLHPRRYTAMSPTMAAIVGAIVNQSFTEPQMHGLAVTSDGYLVSMETFIGSADDFDRNLANLLTQADLTVQERQVFDQLLKRNLADWRSRDTRNK